MNKTASKNQNNYFSQERANIFEYQNSLLKNRNRQLQNENNKLLEQLMDSIQLINSYKTNQTKSQQLLSFKESIDKIIKQNICQCLNLITQDSILYKNFKKIADIYHSQGLISFIQKLMQQYKKSLKEDFQIQKQSTNKYNQKLTDLNRLNSQRLQLLKDKVNKNTLKKQLFVIRLPSKQMDLRKYCDILSDMSQKYKKLFLTLKNPILANEDVFKICHNYYENSLLKLRISNCQLNLAEIQQQWQCGQNQHLCHIKIQQINEKLSQLLKQKQQLQKETDQLKTKIKLHLLQHQAKDKITKK